jgi:3'-phosphoadenosine 5'-phosphosulfate sulfotransferase (PAPS reductase)/FAD synthetase
MEPIINYGGLSGGKDSTATALWLIHESREPLSTMRFTFCDTGNEHQFVYDHIQMLSDLFVSYGCDPVITLKPERDFYELARFKRRFPTRKARFCTQFLKVIPSRNDVTQLIRAGHEVIVHSGVRAGESADRAKLVDRGFSDMFGCVVNRPLLKWSLADVKAIHQRYGVPLNPLYSYGFSRVGCFPCINSKKSEIRLISIKFPERIAEIRKAETEMMETSRYRSFFDARTAPNRFHSEQYVNRKGKTYSVATIDDVVRWSRSGHRANGTAADLDLLKDIIPELEDFDFIEDDRQLSCPSGAGMCE